MTGDTERQDKEEGWTPEEKARGAPYSKPGDAGAAGKPGSKGMPSSDRARTESAVAKIKHSQVPGATPRKP